MCNIAHFPLDFSRMKYYLKLFLAIGVYFSVCVWFRGWGFLSLFPPRFPLGGKDKLTETASFLLWSFVLFFLVFIRVNWERRERERACACVWPDQGLQTVTLHEGCILSYQGAYMVTFLKKKRRKMFILLTPLIPRQFTTPFDPQVLQ